MATSDHSHLHHPPRYSKLSSRTLHCMFSTIWLAPALSRGHALLCCAPPIQNQMLETGREARSFLIWYPNVWRFCATRITKMMQQYLGLLCARWPCIYPILKVPSTEVKGFTETYVVAKVHGDNARMPNTENNNVHSALQTLCWPPVVSYKITRHPHLQ